MKNIQLFLFLIFLIKFNKAQSNASCEIIYQYECGNKFYRYNLDNEPAKYGISAGQYAPGKEAYIGLSIFADIAYQINQLQLDPPGVLAHYRTGQAFLLNDTKKIWYLNNNKNHDYAWVDSQNAEVPPFAIEVAKDRIGISLLIARIKLPNGFVSIGVAVTTVKLMYYVDENGMVKATTSGYQVLTCKSSIKNETKYLTPYYEFPFSNDSDSGCINNWQPYKNDDAPVLNGIVAGEYDCNNTAYVGKSKDSNLTIPGRIQISPQSGLILTNFAKTKLITNGSYYLVNNPNYTYYWTPFDGEKLPNNIVYARSDIGTNKYGIGRVKVNGRTQIGKFNDPILLTPNDEGLESSYENYDILVCDPWPKYQCAQQWKKINDSNLSIDGFSIDSTSFIGRSNKKSVNGCDFGLGKIQVNSNGVKYLDDLTGKEVFDTSSNVEYLVKNSSYTYKWQSSRNGVKVVNALELHKEGHRPSYIGTTRINDNVVVGKVRPDEGLFFIDPITGKQQSTSSYEVLTCTSPDASNGEYEEESNEDWYGDHWCPARKQWSFIKWRCVCRDEFRNVFASDGSNWNEENCTYV